jgi:hypothetical protein
MTQCASLARGRMMRLTRLDECGEPVIGETSTLVTKGYVSVTATPNYREPEEISQADANGDACIEDQADPSLRWLDLSVVMCNIDPDAINILTGDPLVLNNAAPTPEAVGFCIDSSVSGSAKFALELWSGKPGQACTGAGAPEFGYWLFPFVVQARWGEWAIANAALTITFTARTSANSLWGVGPYDVILSAGTNEVQTVTITGTPTGGTYTLTFDGQTTGPIVFNATAAAVQTALEGLTNIDVGDVTAAGGPHPGTAITVTFQGQYAGTDVAQMTADDSALTGGTDPTVTVTTTTPGVAGPASPLLTPVGATDHACFQISSAPLPTPACGAVALA